MLLVVSSTVLTALLVAKIVLNVAQQESVLPVLQVTALLMEFVLVVQLIVRDVFQVVFA